MTAPSPEAPRPAENYERVLAELRQTVNWGQVTETVEPLSEHGRLMAGWLHGATRSEVVFEAAESAHIVLARDDHAGGSYTVEASEYDAEKKFIGMNRVIFVEEYTNEHVRRYDVQTCDRVRSWLNRTHFDRFEAMVAAEKRVSVDQLAAAGAAEDGVIQTATNLINPDWLLAEATAEVRHPGLGKILRALGNLSFRKLLRRRSRPDRPHDLPHDPGE